MSFARVGMFRFQPGTSGEAIRKTQENACAFLQRLPGFLSYRAIKGSGGRAASLSLWETEAQAIDAERQIEEWIREKAESMLISSDVFLGEVTVEEDAPVALPGPAHFYADIPEARH